MGAILRDVTLAPILGGLAAPAVTAPADLTGAARELFDEVAAANKGRPWNAAHAGVLADYCRLSVMYAAEVQRVESEGAVVNGKTNPRFSAMRALSTERSRLARLLGLSVPNYNSRGRDLGNAMSQAAAADVNGYLS